MREVVAKDEAYASERAAEAKVGGTSMLLEPGAS